jgi:deoxyribonuclease-2
MWNDEIPDGSTSSSKAHSKGVMGYASDAGFLLRHSTPRFPPHKRSGYHGLPQNEHIYGQTFLCTSVSISELNRIAGQYLVTDAQIYDHNTPSYANNQHNLTSFATGSIVHNYSPQSLVFKTIGGVSFWDVAKSKACDCDMWDKVSSHYGQSMSVLSWGRPLEPSSCPPSTRFAVENVVHINWGNINYKETDEHSKWGITHDHQTICIGDINRMESQKKRGGGASCLTNAATASAFAKLVSAVEKC